MSGEIKPGVRVRFLDGGPDLVEGIVNGAPWVYFDGTDAVARVPVFVPDGNRCVDVHGGNIFAIGATVADLPTKPLAGSVVGRIADYSRRV